MIRKPEISKSAQGFQLAIDQAKVRLDLSVSQGTWLMPSNLLLNTQSTIGYNNSLKRASFDMKLGVNKSVNLEMKSVGVRHVNGGSSKINRPTSHFSNKINKTSTKVQVKTPLRLDETRSTSDSETNHDIIKRGLISARLVSVFFIQRLFL